MRPYGEKGGRSKAGGHKGRPTDDLRDCGARKHQYIADATLLLPIAWPQGLLSEPEIGTGILDIGGIISPRRRDRMHPATGRTAADQGRQDKGGIATLTPGRKTAIRENPAAQRAPMGLRDKLHQFPPLGKRTTGSMPMTMSMTASTTCTSTHIASPLRKFLLADRPRILIVYQQVSDLSQKIQNGDKNGQNVLVRTPLAAPALYCPAALSTSSVDNVGGNL
jgi:hypothetical protein